MQPMEEIYQSYAMTVYRYLVSLTSDPDLAEELTQETFYQAIRSSDRFEESCKVSTWLCAIAKRVLLTWRRKHPVHESTDDLEIPTEGPEDEVLRSEDKSELLRRIHKLSEPYREVIYLRAFGDLSFREIGDIFGKTENWARVTFYRSKIKLQETE